MIIQIPNREEKRTYTPHTPWIDQGNPSSHVMEAAAAAGNAIIMPMFTTVCKAMAKAMRRVISIARTCRAAWRYSCSSLGHGPLPLQHDRHLTTAPSIASKRSAPGSAPISFTHAGSCDSTTTLLVAQLLPGNHDKDKSSFLRASTSGRNFLGMRNSSCTARAFSFSSWPLLQPLLQPKKWENGSEKPLSATFCMRAPCTSS
mmetsp:Transcript_80772/g.147301  ORF Transcript_80772/g.147301 Transcript_80772/m.147301 type:complete len:202 (-) Transcript_80772:918-1523(-)